MVYTLLEGMGGSIFVYLFGGGVAEKSRGFWESLFIER